MMNSYWPGAAKNRMQRNMILSIPRYNKVGKIVLYRTMKGKDKTRFISDNILEEINKLKNQSGKDILIFGSPSAVHSLMEYNLIDEYTFL